MRWCANCSKRPCRITGGRGPRLIGCWRSPNAGPISSAIRARSAGKKYMSVAKAFFNTNILLYMYGGSDPAKQAKAAELFNALAHDRAVPRWANSGCQRRARPAQRVLHRREQRGRLEEH